MTGEEAKTTLRLGDHIRVGTALGYNEGMVTELTQSHFLLDPQDDTLSTKAIPWTTNEYILRTTPSGTVLPEPPPPDTCPVHTEPTAADPSLPASLQFSLRNARPQLDTLRTRAEKAEARANGYQRDAALWYKRWDADNSRAEKAEGSLAPVQASLYASNQTIIALRARAEKAEAERDTWRDRAAIVGPLVGRAEKAEANAIAQRERAEKAEAELDAAIGSALTNAARFYNLRARIEAVCDTTDAVQRPAHDNFAQGVRHATKTIRAALAEPKEDAP